MSSSLRQRQRREILQSEADDREEDRHRTLQTNRISSVQSGSSGLLGKIYAVILLVLLLGVGGVMQRLRPHLLPWNRKRVKKLMLGSFFPQGISPKRDLPPVVKNYAIATPDNKETRDALLYTIQQRSILKSRSLRVLWNLWEQQDVDEFVVREGDTLCGEEFRDTYRRSPIWLQHDLVMWCRMEHSWLQGIMEYGIEFHRSLGYYRNMAVRYLGQERILSWLLISTLPSRSTVPSKMMAWLLAYNDESDWDETNYRQKQEEHLFTLIQQDETVKWTLLDAVCGDDGDNDLLKSRKKLATVCRHGQSCCNIYELPNGSAELDENSMDDDDNLPVKSALLLRH